MPIRVFCMRRQLELRQANAGTLSPNLTIPLPPPVATPSPPTLPDMGLMPPIFPSLAHPLHPVLLAPAVRVPQHDVRKDLMGDSTMPGVCGP